MAVSLFVEEFQYERERRPDDVFTHSGGGLENPPPLSSRRQGAKALWH
jgi:hypothetical protein